jgi:predicted TPR repeat methyltransferase
MANDELIPPNVDERDALLLRRAYALSSQEEGEALYREWASSYDRTMVDGLGYIAPGLLCEAFARAVPWRDGPVLDIGCGTGLVGDELVQRGFTTFDGLDLSVEMMNEARHRGIYHELIAADLTKPLPIGDRTYRAVVCNGTFTSGHVDASCLDEIVRIIEPGGLLACAVHHSVWHALGFADAFDRLVRVGVLAMVERVAAPYYASSPGTDGRLCVFSRR